MSGPVPQITSDLNQAGSGDGFDNLNWDPTCRIDAVDLESHPEIETELERLVAGPIPAESTGHISPRQWHRFHHRVLDDDYRPYFIAFDKLYSGAVEDELVPWTLDTPWLRQTARGIGAVAMVFGFAMFVASYRTTAARPGLPIASPWLALFCDVISLIGGLIFIGLAIDTLWVSLLGQPSLIGLQPEWPSSQPFTGLHFISVPVVLIALPLLTLWFTSLSAQRIEVNDERVTSHGALGSRSIPWLDLERVNLREQKNPFAFTVVDFRSLQKVLDLEGAEHSVTINEPGSRERKLRIMNALREHVPEALFLARKQSVEIDFGGLLACWQGLKSWDETCTDQALLYFASRPAPDLAGISDIPPEVADVEEAKPDGVEIQAWSFLSSGQWDPDLTLFDSDGGLVLEVRDSTMDVIHERPVSSGNGMLTVSATSSNYYSFRYLDGAMHGESRFISGTGGTFVRMAVAVEGGV